MSKYLSEQSQIDLLDVSMLWTLNSLTPRTFRSLREAVCALSETPDQLGSSLWGQRAGVEYTVRSDEIVRLRKDIAAGA